MTITKEQFTKGILQAQRDRRRDKINEVKKKYNDINGMWTKNKCSKAKKNTFANTSNVKKR